MLPTLIKKTMACTLLLACITLLFFSCQKELSGENNGTPDQPADLTTKVTISTASGFITDENNAPVKDAIVQLGTSTTNSDKFGYFEFKNTEVVKNAAFVSVTKPGYFKGFKTFTASAGKGFFTRIKLIPKTIKGNINAASGGNVTLSNGLIIALPANAVVNAATGAAYSGTISVAAFHINPEAADLNEIMPGDLQGINKTGALKLLQTYGMAAVELTGSGGELLQIASGKKATLTMPIPASLSATAPASIPLWYFDETKGLWKEEGSAVKTGNTYMGDVAHFSFWNCDYPLTYVQLSVTFQTPNGQPLQYTLVRITQLSNPANHREGWTDANGYVSGLVPDNSQLLMEVSGYNNCGGALYSQTITTTSVALSLGTITVNSTVMASISGTALDCSNNPVTNGRVIMKINNLYYVSTLSGTGTFNFNFGLCSATTADITAEDFTVLQSGPTTNYPVIIGNNTIGNISACGSSTQQFMNYTINGTTYSFTYPADSLFQTASYNPNNIFNVPVIYQSGYRFNPYQSAELFYTQAGISASSIQDLKKFWATQVSPDTMLVTTPIPVNITEYGNVGQFISGNFSGTLTGRAPTNTPYVVTCSFRVRRSQ